MRKSNSIFLIPICLCLGCGVIKQLFSVESPRPNKEQINATQSITETVVPVIANTQTDKQRKISGVTRAALVSLPKCTTKEQVQAVTNITANAIDGIQYSDGTGKALAVLQGKTTGDILKMPVVEYLAYVKGQGEEVGKNIEKVKEGIKIVGGWSKQLLWLTLFGGTGGTGMIAAIAIMIRKLLLKNKLLVTTGKVINEYMKENEIEGEVLQTKLAKAHSKVAMNAEKEFRIG